LSAAFGVTTSLQLMEISRPTHPLLRQLLLKAPGTYHHTLIVANMAERAAEAVGADTLLTRVGAYYHDVGKTIRPYFFIENRSDMDDPHARLDPSTSAQVIIAHVKDGIELARKHRLPGRIVDFIPEHHGTSLVAYFYHQAVKQVGDADRVDRAQFRYPGPKPRSRETASPCWQTAPGHGEIETSGQRRGSRRSWRRAYKRDAQRGVGRLSSDLNLRSVSRRSGCAAG
jgi:putative nucleotidyltransferase with HDIG domain